jgi:hypothetical protein
MPLWNAHSRNINMTLPAWRIWTLAVLCFAAGWSLGVFDVFHALQERMNQ